ncbi:PilZ domain-containing protein [Sphingopyxis fribergensis]
MQASLILPGRADPVVVRVRNLSAGGMLAEAKVQIAQGATVEVDLRNVGPVPGRIVWAGEGKFGIAFDRPVDPQAVRRQVVSESDLPPHLRRTGLERGLLYRRR